MASMRKCVLRELARSVLFTSGVNLVSVTGFFYWRFVTVSDTFPLTLHTIYKETDFVIMSLPIFELASQLHVANVF